MPKHQEELTSGSNIKTINSQSILGAGNIILGGTSSWGNISGVLSNQTDLQSALNGKSDTSHVHTFASLTSKPTTISGYGITDFNSLGDVRWSLLGHNHVQTDITGLTTSLAGKSNIGHTHSITDVQNLQSSLDLKADLVAGVVPSSQLPSYVDDVLEYTNLASFPGTGETGKIYIALDTNKVYRWSGSAYIYITSGAVDTVNGQTGVVTITAASVGLGNVDNTSDANKPVSTAQQTALNAKQATLVSGTNIKTINSTSLLGSGDISVATSAQGTLADNAVPNTRTVNGKQLNTNITLNLASSDFANQGTTTTVLKGNAAGNPSFGSVNNSDMATMPTKTYKGNTTGGTAVPTDVPVATLKSDLGLTKSDVGLGNVDNTADVNKVVSTAGAWTTARLLAGNSVNGASNVAFTNKFIVQGTSDAGLTGAQFLGSLGTGIVKNTTSTGVLTIAVADTDYQSVLVSGTNIKTINGNSILGSGDLVISGGGGGTWGSITGTLSNQTDLQSALNDKQATLVSGTNIKTINSTSLLGSGDISVATSAQGTLADNAVPNTRTVNGKQLNTNITLNLASSDFANQGTTTTVLKGNAAGNPSFGSVNNSDMTVMVTNSVKLNATAGSAVPTDFTIGTNTVLGRVGGNIVASQIVASQITSGTITDNEIATGNKDGITTTPSMRTLGVGSQQACAGNDSRLSDARTPLSHTHGNIANNGSIGSTSNLPIITTTSGVLTTGSFGSSANTFCQGNDSRLSDARTPLSHNHIINDTTGLQTALDSKQATLVSGTNIKTINGESILGSGNLDVIGGGGMPLPSWYGVLYAAFSDCNPSSAYNMSVSSGTLSPTMTQWGTSTARIAYFIPPADIVVNKLRYFGVGSTSNFRIAIYNGDNLTRLTSDFTANTASGAWGETGNNIGLTLLKNQLYFIAISTVGTGTTSGFLCMSTTISTTTGLVGVLPKSFPGSLNIDMGYLSGAFAQFTVTSGVLPVTAPTIQPQGTWTGGFPLIFLDNNNS